MSEDIRRTIAKLKRKLVSSESELKLILSTGRSASKDSSKVTLFEGMYTALEKYYSLYETSFHELAVLSEEPEAKLTFPSSEDTSKQSGMRNAYYEIKQLYVGLTKDQNPSTSRSSVNESVIIRENASPHLPEIKLVPFDSEILNWPKFRDVFVSIVDQDKILTPAKKFHYLITNVKGPAHSLINKFQITDQNYPLAWAALCEAYDKKRLLSTAYLNRVLNFHPLHGKPTIEGLKSFMTTVCDSVSSFELLGIENESKFILFHLAFRLLDPTTRDQFQNSHRETEFPTFDQLFKFIKDRCFAMQITADTNSTFDSSLSASKPEQSGSKYRGTDKRSSYRHHGKTSLVAQQSHTKHTITKHTDQIKFTPCFICKDGSHGLLSCKKCCSADVKQRVAWLVNWRGCTNCLSVRHQLNDCKSKWLCRWCKGHHNSMLCEVLGKGEVPNPPASSSGTYSASPGAYAATNQDQSHSQVILGTLLAEVQDSRGFYQTVRIVVDSASHYSFMTYKCANRLGLVQNRCNLEISGIGQSQGGVRNIVDCSIKPVNQPSPTLQVKALLLKSITSFLPTASLPHRLWTKFCKFPLADPTFFESKPVDILLGADLFSEIWLGSPIEVDCNSPKLFPSIFGHIVIGKFTSEPSALPSTHRVSLISVNPITIDDISLNLRRFWELEEPKPSVTVVNPEEVYCEDHFKSTHYRLEDGTYGVRLPFRTNPPEFKNIDIIARRRFLNQENRLINNSRLREQYHVFMQEYEDLKHMSQSSNSPAYIIPHHAVFKIDRNQLKARVVFDGSTQSAQGQGAINDYLMAGPKLQSDIRDILLNFRFHKCALVVDIVKFFRGIQIHPDDRKYQSIYWRYDPLDALKVYELNTVVYGLTSSPFHANRVIRALVEDHGPEFPDASEVLHRDIYVDDIVTGRDSLEEALILQGQLIALLRKGCFKLSKWASNCPELLKNVSESSDQPVTIISKDDTSVKILGLQWNPKTDCFSYTLDLPNVLPTKRSILSNVSKIYDPLGFISPLVITMKQFIQELWKLGAEWDEPVPLSIASRWKSALDQLPRLSALSIPRFVKSNNSSTYQIVGFADASEIAFCAALYLLDISSQGTKISLLVAKTKLAPLKKLTIPRLELCGCYLLARLLQSISQFLDLFPPHSLRPSYFFTDSTIALGWLRTPTYKLKTFVCNRVTEILQVTTVDQWHHVLSEENPADSGSRGLLPHELLENRLWWDGPHWLARPDVTWNLLPVPDINDLPEMKPERAALISVESTTSFSANFIIDIISKFSAFYRLLRSLAYVLRFVRNLKDKLHRQSGPLNLQEIRSAKTLCVKAVQLRIFFKNDLSERRQAEVMKQFVKLNPFFDSSGILRAGGRLFHSSLPFNHKHPILLPSESHLTILIVDHFHRIYLHPGPSTLQAVVQLEYWIPSLRRLTQQRVFHCTRCYRLKSKTLVPKMADLPAYRVRATRAFLKTGLDFCGPFQMKDSFRRRAQLSKVYLCIFVCMATRAIHIEPVTNLTADAFLAALDRFASLRGLPTDLYSDCGSNFVSAARHLKEWYQWFIREDTQTLVIEKMSIRHINWHFNPPHAPHFGGIWEAGVKSAKSLMIRSIGDIILTYEELATLVAKISAVLNSRPLCPLSTDPSECEYLSPGHFIIGEAPLAIPEPTLLDTNINRLDRWQLIKRISQHFWERWHREYLATLQHRSKWTSDAANIKVGDLVFLKDERQPILLWPRARVISVHPGSDGIVRVATVKTPTSTFTRPVAKLVPLLPPRNELQPQSYIPRMGEGEKYRRWVRGAAHGKEDTEEGSSSLDSHSSPFSPVLPEGQQNLALQPED